MIPFPKTILLDMDGVIWRCYQPVVDLKLLFDDIRSNGARAFCITNNSTGSVQSYLEKLAAQGVELDPDQIISSAAAAAHELTGTIPAGGTVYLIGEDGLKDMILGSGFEIATDDRSPVDAVVVGLDFQINYLKISQAANLIRAGADFIGTNPDHTFPAPTGVYPGAGSIIAAVETASGTQPKIMGKPAPYLYKLVLERSGSDPDQTLMIGDRLETDILGAQRLGIKTALVLTGVTERSQAESWSPPPDFIAENALDVIKELSR